MISITLALVAQLVIGITLVIDKTFLKEKSAGNVFAYVFWIGLFNFFSIFVAPFDFVNPGFVVGLIAFLAGIFFLAGLIFYYKALEGGEASQTLAILGGFTPVATIIVSQFVLKNNMNIIELILFVVLTLGGFFMFLADRNKFRKTIIWIILSAICFGIVNVFQKVSYDGSNFLTGYAIMKSGAFIGSLALLVVPNWRKQIFSRTKETSNNNKVFYLSNRALAGIASVGLSYAIMLGNPSLVESTSALKYVVIFIIALILTKWWPKILKENFSKKVLALKIAATILIIIAIAGLTTQKFMEDQPKLSQKDMNFGVSFSTKMSESFGLNWRENYLAIVNDLHPSAIRIMAYWDQIEPKKGNWNFTDLDWQVKEAQKANIPVIISVGQKVPRWPECHFPKWLDQNNADLRKNELMVYEKVVVERYRREKNLLYWQVENEPYMPFGICPKSDKKLVEAEVDLVRKIDPDHKILLTDGGEWGMWYKQVKDGDVFGTTMYRKVYKKGVGSIHPPLTPEYYDLKRTLVAALAGKKDQKFIISELGVEPWWGKQIYELPISKQQELLSNQEIDQFIDFARRSNFDTVYLWSAEWWYYMKTQNDPSYWNHMKNLMKK